MTSVHLTSAVPSGELLGGTLRGTDAQIPKERELTCSAIRGAMAFGYQGENPPPDDNPRSDWLKPFWEAGRTQRELLEALKLCAAVCAGETVNKSGLIDALEKARAVMVKVGGPQ